MRVSSICACTVPSMCASATHDIVTGAAYVKQITARESDRRARSAFQSLVLRIAQPGGALFDFGAGPGIDARFYAESGYTVAAYDVDPRMREFFAVNCRECIEAGRVTVGGGDYREFLAHKGVEGVRGIDLVTSNFAPLNLIDDLRELFARFHALTGPDGRVLASVLSPHFIGDLKYGWWWRNSLRLWRDGRFSVQGAQAPIVRRRIADFAAQSAPYFTLKRVFRGLPPSKERDAAGVDPNGGSLSAALHVSTCQFMFLLFEKQST
jgi:SAM-dependent methyltransferase